MLLFPIAVQAQVGGVNSYEFLQLPIDARVAALGGTLVSIKDQDVNLFLQNPAALNADMVKRFSISYMPFLAGIKASNLAYVLPYSRNNVLGLGLTFLDYGKMQETTADGTVIGTFSVAEYALTGAVSHRIGNYIIGANLKFAASHFADYNSFAILGDFGGMFVHPDREWTVGFVVKNLGYAFDRYTAGRKVNLPFDVQIGTSYKLENLPFRFTLTAHDLSKFDIVYLDPNQKNKKDLQGNEIVVKKKLGDQILRHFNLAGEFLLSKNFNIRVGYNHLRRKELRLEDRSGGAGFSLGGVMRIRSFEFAYTRSFYSVGAGGNHITLVTNFNSLLKKRERKKNNQKSND